MESDRTERLDRELRDLGQIADTTPLGIFRMTAERRLTYVNRRFADMFGLDVGDFLPRVPEEFGRRRVEAELLEQYVPADEDAPTADLGGVEFNIVAPETSQVINVRLFAAFDATGAPTPLGYCQDVTEQ